MNCIPFTTATMADWIIRPVPQIQATLQVPGDKSISHRAVLLAAISDGTSEIRGFLPSADCMRTVEAMRALGVTIQVPEPTTLVVQGCRGTFRPAPGAIDCGNSGTTMRLLAGLVAGQTFRTRLTGDRSLSTRPMRRIVEPLTRMGATVHAEGPDGRPPLMIEGAHLQSIEHSLATASAQAKSAVLLAGLFARGVTTVSEPSLSRDHTERMLDHFGVAVQRAGLTVSITGGQTLQARSFSVPGDISSAAFWFVAAAARPGSSLLVENVGLNPTRSGVLAVLSAMGAGVEVAVTEPATEPSGRVRIDGAQLQGTHIGGDEIANVIDELPVLAVAAALAHGRTTISGAGELRVKESDRLNAIATNLRALGAEVEETGDGMVITGGRPLHGARLHSFGDHRIAMAFAIAGLFAHGETTIIDTDCVATSYPGFPEQLCALCAA